MAKRSISYVIAVVLLPFLLILSIFFPDWDENKKAPF
jgi:hypothetical protein